MALPLALFALSAGSAIAGGIFQAKAGSAERRLANKQAALIDEQAELATLAGQVQTRQIRYAGRRAVGEQVASAGAGGVAVSGSVLDRVADIHTQVDLDLLTTAFNASTQARHLKIQAGITRERGKMVETAGQIGGALSALGGVTQAGAYYYGSSQAAGQYDALSQALNIWAQSKPR